MARDNWKISDQMVADELRKAHKETVAEARAAIQRGDLSGEGIALYLPTIEEKYDPIKNVVRNAIDGQLTNIAEDYAQQYSVVERDIETFDGELRRLNSAQLELEQVADEADIPKDQRPVQTITYDNLRDRIKALKGVKH